MLRIHSRRSRLRRGAARSAKAGTAWSAERGAARSLSGESQQSSQFQTVLPVL